MLKRKDSHCLLPACLASPLRGWYRFVAVCVLFLGVGIFTPVALLGSVKMPTDLQPGVVLVDNVEGRIVWENKATGERIALKEGTLLRGAFTLESFADSTATLMFANGMGIEVAPETRLTLQGFQQTPHSVKPEEFRSLDHDPAQSYTSLFVERGRIAGHAEKLNPTSLLFVQTPQIYAEIRGTIFTFEHFEGQARSEVGVYEGNIAVVAKTAMDQNDINVLRTTLDPQSDLSPLETLLGTGQTLSVESQERDIVLVMDNITQNEYNAFVGKADDFANKLGIGPSAMRSAVANAYGGVPRADGGPSRLTTIQSTSVKTSLGPGFKLVIRTSDDGSDAQGNPGEAYNAVETVVGAEIKNDDGSTTTISRKTVLALSSLNGVLNGTVYTATTKEVMQPDGSFTLESTVSSNTYINPPADVNTWLDVNGSINTAVLTSTPITQTYTASTIGNADGTSAKTASGNYVDTQGTIATTESVNTSFDANGKLQRVTTRTLNGVTTTYIDPISSIATLSFLSNANDEVIVTSTATDENGNSLGTRSSSTRFGRNQKTTTVTGTDAQGQTEDFIETVTLGTGSSNFQITTEPRTPVGNAGGNGNNAKTETQIERLANGGSRTTTTQTLADGTRVVTIEENLVFDNGNIQRTKTITTTAPDNTVTHSTDNQQVKIITNTDGSQTITTINNANGDGTIGNGGDTFFQFTIRDGETINSTSGTLTGTGDDQTILDGIDDAISKLIDNVIVSP